MVEQLIVQDREKEALELYHEFLLNTISRLKNQLSEEKEQIGQLQAFHHFSIMFHIVTYLAILE